MKMPLLDPNSRIVVVWEVYILLITILVNIISPLLIVFRISMTPQLVFFEILVTLSFFADIAVQFNTSYSVRHVVITDRKKIASRYLKKGFTIDLLAALPFTWFLGFLNFSSLRYASRYFRLARLFKLIRSTRTLNRARNLRFVNPSILRLLILVFWILVAAHLVACGWILIGGTTDFSNTGNAAENRGVYLEAFYWTVTTLSTIGYGDITPETQVQMVFVIFIMLMGAALYGVIIGNIANIIANIDVAKSQFREKMENIDTFLKYRGIPGRLQTRIHEYYDYLWESRRGYEESKLLEDLPKSLKTQVVFFLNREIIEKVPLFKDASHEFIRDVILNLKPAIFMPGDTVVAYGEIGYEMYFISRGEVDVTSKDGAITYATLTTGQFFGEIALLLSTPRTATVKARVYCDLYVLDKSTFDSILQRYPRFAKIVEELSDARREELGLNKGEDEQIEIPDIGGSDSGVTVSETLSYQLLDDRIIRISWPPIPGADSYEIVRRSGGTGNWRKLSLYVRNPVYLDLHPPSGEIQYRVRGKGKNGYSGWCPILTLTVD